MWKEVETKVRKTSVVVTTTHQGSQYSLTSENLVGITKELNKKSLMYYYTIYTIDT